MRWASVATVSSWDEDKARLLPVPWKKLRKIVRPKGGNVCVIIAAPGVGKTVLLLNWMQQTNAKCLYMSADTSAMDVTEQLGAMVTSHERVIVQKRLVENESWRRDYATAVFNQNPNLVLDFTSSPSMKDVQNKALALTEMWGETPDFVVIDTASDVQMKDKGDNAEWQRMWLTAKAIARELNTFVILAHHVRSGEVKSGRIPPELKDGMWGCEQFPEFVFGLHSRSTAEIVLTVLKNRGGPKNVPVPLNAHLSRAQITDQEVML